ncbi:MAG: hypothetical protein FVQ85_04000 [Planctomycetes bacterium]|nr:hypothetical protein [Planctomycetota bacterium]
MGIKNSLRTLFLRILKSVDDKARQDILLEATSEMTKRFLSQSDDIERMRQILDSQRFGRIVKPISVDMPDANNILIFAPHQDDETIGAAGTILRCVSYGKRVQVIYVTDGAAATKPSNQKDLAVTRKEEAKKAWSFINGTEPVFLDLHCRNIPLTMENAEKMRRQISDFQPDCIFIPFFLEPPLDHRAVNQLLLMAHKIEPLSESLQIWAYQVSAMVSANVVVDITDLIDKKDAVNSLWKSQNVNFNYAHFARGMAAYNSIFLKKEFTPCPKKCYAEIFFVSDAAEYISLIDTYFGAKKDTSG